MTKHRRRRSAIASADFFGPTIDAIDLPRDILAKRLELRGDGPQYSARCPAHDDGTPSLSVRILEDERALIHCHAGCDPQTILARIGLNYGHLNPSGFARDMRRIKSGASNAAPSVKTAVAPDFGAIMSELRPSDPEALTDHALGLGFTVESLAALGVGLRGDDLAFPECDADGNVVGILYRSRNGRKVAHPSGRRGLFLPAHPRNGRTLYVTEGATDTAALLSVDESVVGRSSARLSNDAMEWLRTVIDSREPDRVIVIADNDETGIREACALVRQLGELVATPISAATPQPEFNDIREQVAAGSWNLNLNQLEVR